MGAGHCGLSLLPQILNTQPGTCVTHEELPWLPWVKGDGGRREDRGWRIEDSDGEAADSQRDGGSPGIRERLRRMLATRTEQRVGDVASFYLPYVEEAIEVAPDIRIVCLQRPREEVVAGLRQSLIQPAGDSTNHWAKVPAAGWSHDPSRTFIFPQYESRISARESAAIGTSTTPRRTVYSSSILTTCGSGIRIC